MNLLTEDILRMLFSILIGGLIGIEREYRTKAAGFRTITLISLGATVFTLMSMKIGDPISKDRIASNIVTGIGFLGAGVIFKDGLTITGLTTATSIWVTAALGMVVAYGDYWMAFAGLVAVLLVLSLFEELQNLIDRIHQKKGYKIVYDGSIITDKEIENIFHYLKINFRKRKQSRINTDVTVYYEVYGNMHKLNELNAFLVNYKDVKSFES
jgi:putative Mg2+ transporter-C (MgtC) family protein